MRHAILGAGGVGGLLAAALARAGADVVLLMRAGSLAAYPGRLEVESAALGDFEVDVPAAPTLDREVDVVWVAVKSTNLTEALTLVPPNRVGSAIVVPLLNGVDHLATLRERFAAVVAGAIRVESERVAPGRIRQSSPFLRVDLAGAEHAAEDLRTAGIDCRVREHELSVLWEKLCFLAPLALATTALDVPLGGVRGDRRYLGCQDEALAVARAEGAHFDEAGLRAVQQGAPDAVRSSMQKDVAAGREPELDAIAGPILRGGRRHAIGVEMTAELADLVRVRVEERRGATSG